MTVSMVSRCYETETIPITLSEVWETIRTGDHDIKGRIIQIRSRYEMEKDITGDPQKAKKAVADLKMELPGFLPSGSFSKRETGALVEYSGLLCADLDSLGDRLAQIRDILKTMPFVRAIALSPSGDGLKVFFNVINDPARHEDSFRSIRENLKDLEIEIDEKCKDPARICFFTYDPDLYLAEAGEIIPPAEPLPPPTPGFLTSADVSGTLRTPPGQLNREQIAFGLLGELRPCPEKNGYFVRCPGESFHTAKTAGKHTILYLQTVPTLSCQHQSCAHVVESFNKVLRSEIGKAEFVPRQQSRNGPEPPPEEKILIEFLRPSQFKSYTPPDNLFMVGDCHIMRGSTSVMAGPPGVGKSRWLFELAYCGATQKDFFGLKVHRQFKTLIIQNENGKYRIGKQFISLDCVPLDGFIRITPPPAYGLSFGLKEFRDQLKEEIDREPPDMMGIDPWNSVAKEQDSREYLETFELIRSVMPRGDDAPALVISCHTRKPKAEERASGRALLHLVAGSYVMGSVPRCVWVMQHASSDTTETAVVLTCCKNNDGELGPRSAWDWDETSGVFLPVASFNWDEFDLTEKERHDQILQSDVEAVLKCTPMQLVDAVKALKTLTNKSDSTCRRALHPKGKFANHLARDKEGNITWIP